MRVAVIGLAGITFCATVVPAQSRGAAESIDALRSTFVRGYNAGSIEALAPLYTGDAVRMVYDTPPQRGRDEIVGALRRSFAARRADVLLTLRAEEVNLLDTLAIERGSYHEVWSFANGAPPYVETGKYVTLARREAGWKYAWSIFNRDSAPPARRVSVALATPGALVGDSIVSPRWRSWGDGLEMAILNGDPDAPDQSYTIALRLAPGRWIRPHWHPRAKQVYVVSGALRFGHGEAFDTARTALLPPGTIASVKERHAHFEGAVGQTVILLSGIGPLQTSMVQVLPTRPD